MEKEIAVYVRNHVDNFEEYLQLALVRMDKSRCPFWMAADEGFYNEIIATIEEWCLDNDVDCSEWDFGELIEGSKGIIWED